MADYFGPEFFARDAHKVARELMGHHLCRQVGGKSFQFTLNEIEVYDGFDDRASHAFGKDPQKGRSSIMFGRAGICYVYLCYGVHWMLNIVTREPGYPSALLIRGCAEVKGPGRLTQMLKIDKSLNGKLALPENKLWFAPNPLRKTRLKIQKSPRVGVNYAGEEWAGKPWRLTS